MESVHTSPQFRLIVQKQIISTGAWELLQGGECSEMEQFYSWWKAMTHKFQLRIPWHENSRSTRKKETWATKGRLTTTRRKQKRQMWIGGIVTRWTSAKQGVGGLSSTVEGGGRRTPTPRQRPIVVRFQSVTTGSPWRWYCIVRQQVFFIPSCRHILLQRRNKQTRWSSPSWNYSFPSLAATKFKTLCAVQSLLASR